MRAIVAFLLALAVTFPAQALDIKKLYPLLGSCPSSLQLSGVGCPPNVINFAAGIGKVQGNGVGSASSLITTSRASVGTNLLPTSASGAAYVTFANNVARITAGLGILVEEGRTNYLLNSTAPVTQTTASLGTGTYTLWVNGAGSATSSAGTATGSGFGAATNGSINTFTLTVAGTVTVTVSGVLNAFQLELNPGTVGLGTSLIVTAGTTAARAADAVTMPWVPGPAYWLFGKATPAASASYTVNAALLGLSDGTFTNQSVLWKPSGGGAGVQIRNAGTNTSFGSGTTWNSGSSGKLAATFASGSQIVAFNGGNTYAASVSLPSGLTKVDIGGRDGSPQPWNGYIAEIAFGNGTVNTQAITSGP